MAILTVIEKQSSVAAGIALRDIEKFVSAIFVLNLYEIVLQEVFVWNSASFDLLNFVDRFFQNIHKQFSKIAVNNFMWVPKNGWFHLWTKEMYAK